ncbi:cysteine-rich receptor-like protein kinase 19 isoform X2 [Ipomoea triloba]|uniref:cysteine-rich receptor-like protein kinase 19 isoform X2 n=1 Tax=Ipomoea triloba TaxID=35885 RepID=UPI00125D3619|nr:cysteine-rich receptor-like protein kinase 19 isoform X2 [Ipomoea triloba]
MDLQKWIAFHIFLSLQHLISITIADIDPNTELHECGARGRYTQSSTYSKNLNILLSSLSKNVNEYGFYTGSVGKDIERASAIVLCRGDAELNECRSCVSDNAEKILQSCPYQKEAFQWYNICSIYYSDKSIIGSLNSGPIIEQYSSSIILQQSDQFSQDLTTLVDSLTTQAADGGPFLKYAADNMSGPDQQTIYAYVQCTPGLSVQDCTDCLNTAFTLWKMPEGINNRTGASILCPSCFFRYENTSFIGAMSVKEPPSPPISLRTVIIIIGVSTAAATGLIIITIFSNFHFLMQKRQAKAKSYAESEAVEESGPSVEMSPVESHLQYELIVIQNATNNFSKANKVGEGRFGPVYKGKLEDGQLVAVKRLSDNSRQGYLEFKNEVALMTRLQHRNLVRLLGYCHEETKIILVYEFVPNGNLDSILFGSNPQARLSLWFEHGPLNWEKRYKIILGIARGLVYLHEDSRLPIIHRNLHANNILLDAYLNPKIADFGIARLFALHKTHCSTTSIMGTNGYMAPEYALYGQLSVKSDVYSFGVLVLEIISRQKIASFQNGKSMKNLLSYAWTHWIGGSALNVIDPMLRGTSSPVHEITNCIHIALLCVQENDADRPKMVEALQMLSNLSMSLPVPQAPGIFFNGSISSQVSSQFTKYQMPISDQYYSTIQNATDNFSEANKVGIGILGPVYKGKFENGEEVTVKRFLDNSWQGMQEFKNEVALLAKLQHNNFVRLLGFCQEGKEMLLVYEFVSNGGLDQFLFDPIKCGYLNWGRRYKIITSIARGLVYLHEDSCLRIIHRDLKASNILLDVNLNPKISNFSMAWLFDLDETDGSTDRIAGTYGYMAPEYAWHGQFSAKSDVYSFGVLVLEIISGQRRINFQNGESIKYLPSYAWTHWKNGSSSNVIDPMLRGISSPVPDIMKCIHIALLCVQEKVEDRPTMDRVLQMLSNLSLNCPVPSAPGFFNDSSLRSRFNIINEM